MADRNVMHLKDGSTVEIPRHHAAQREADELAAAAARLREAARMADYLAGRCWSSVPDDAGACAPCGKFADPAHARRRSEAVLQSLDELKERYPSWKLSRAVTPTR